MINSATEFIHWLDAPASVERINYLYREEAETSIWLQIIEEYPRAHRAVTRNWNVPIEVLEKLRHDTDFGVQWQVRSKDIWRKTYPNDAAPYHYDLEELVNYDLTQLERDVLWHGLLHWGGPVSCTEELAVAMGFVSVSDLQAEGDRIRASLIAHEPMKHIDWARAMNSVEIIFISDSLGAASDWDAVTGISDADTFKTIRDLQNHLIVFPPSRTPRPTSQ